MNIKLDWNDISLVPSDISYISSRSEINFKILNKLPIFTAPMDTVVDLNNYKHFNELGINICFPRNIKYSSESPKDAFYSVGIKEAELMLSYDNIPKNLLIDVANGHMSRLLDISKKLKQKFGESLNLMVGNIANPQTYREYCKVGVDFIRVGIGAGSACTTSANASIHYPMASLINECYQISREFDNPTKIVADGGFKNYSDIIKALALGADYVMLGGIFNKAIESCSDNFYETINGSMEKIDQDKAIDMLQNGYGVYKYFRGMSTKEVQKSWNKSELKTGEGITKFNLVEYTLSGWVENFSDYLKSAMSYCGSNNLESFRGKAKWIHISQSAFNRFNK